jgi:hypothetical protein
MTKYIEITEEIKQQLLTLADGVFTEKPAQANGYPVREYRDIHPQFKGFPVKYILEGIEAGKSPEDISNDIYYYMKYGKAPEVYTANKTESSLYTGVPMRNYSEGPDLGSDQENMLRFISGKVMIELTKLVESGNTPTPDEPDTPVEP